MGRGLVGALPGEDMYKSISDGGDRRDDARIAPKGSVVLQVAAEDRRGRVGNVGLGGMLVADVTAPSNWAGRSVDFEIRFDGARAEWLRGTGRILRVEVGALAVGFDTPSSAELLRALGEMTTAADAHDRVMSVVIIDANPQRRSSIAAGFRATGCAVEEADTPLDAIARLGATNFEPDVIVVADSQPSNVADDMRAFVEREHRDALLVTIGDALLAPGGMDHWLSSADPKADLAARVRAILFRV